MPRTSVEARHARLGEVQVLGEYLGFEAFAVVQVDHLGHLPEAQDGPVQCQMDALDVLLKHEGAAHDVAAGPVQEGDERRAHRLAGEGIDHREVAAVSVRDQHVAHFEERDVAFEVRSDLVRKGLLALARQGPDVREPRLELIHEQPERAGRAGRLHALLLQIQLAVPNGRCDFHLVLVEQLLEQDGLFGLRHLGLAFA